MCNLQIEEIVPGILGRALEEGIIIWGDGFNSVKYQRDFREGSNMMREPG